MKTPAAVLSVLFSLVGLVDAGYLTVLKVENSVTGKADSVVCRALSEHGCELAMDSSLSSVLGVPVSLFAIAAYLFIIGFTVLRLSRGQAGQAQAAPSFARDATHLVVVGSLIWTLILAAYSAAQGSFCPLCVGLYGVNVALFGSVWWDTGRPPGADLLQRLGALFRARRALFGSLAAFVGFLVSGHMTIEWEIARGRTVRLATDEGRIAGAFAEGWVPSPLEGAPTHGLAAAPLTIVKFSDFQCPYCRRYFEQLDAFEESSPGMVKVAFRHFPLSSGCNPFIGAELHGRACAAAEAAVCAQEQGRFFEFARVAFANQTALEATDLRRHAETAQVDLAILDACLASPRPRAAILRDTLLGRALGVESTPTSVINGLLISGGLRVESLRHFSEALPARLAAERPRVSPVIADLVEMVTAVGAPLPVVRRVAQGDPSAPTIEVRVEPDTVEGRATLLEIMKMASAMPRLATLAVRIQTGPECTPGKQECERARRLACAWAMRAEIGLSRALSTEPPQPLTDVDASTPGLAECAASSVADQVLVEDRNALLRFPGQVNVLVDGRPLRGTVNAPFLERAVAVFRLSNLPGGMGLLDLTRTPTDLVATSDSGVILAGTGQSLPGGEFDE